MEFSARSKVVSDKGPGNRNILKSVSAQKAKGDSHLPCGLS